MDRKDILKNVYDDFFGVDRLSRENEKLTEDIANLTGINLGEQEIPTIEVQNVENKTQETHSEEEKNEIMQKLYETIDNLYIDSKSKELLKKIIEYMRKYNEGIEKQHISFDMIVVTTNNETVKSIITILEDAGSFFGYIRSGQGATFSMYDVEKVEQISDMYADSNNIVIMQDLEGFNSKEQEFKDRFIHKLDENTNKLSNEVITIIVASNEEIANQMVELNESIKDKLDDFIIKGVNPEVQDAYQDILEKIKEKMEVDEEFQVKLLDYISTTYPNNNLPYPKYRDGICEKIIFSKEIPEYEKEKTMDEIFAELNSLVGLEKVKQVLKDLVSLIELKDKAQDDLKIKNVNLHMIFLGNPGTGKTTVARIVAQILYNLKYVKQNKLIEVSSKDLVAEYVGQTAPKTMAVVQKALGGVLFVDEAYSLATGDGQGNSYNAEAIATLIQAMENYRDNLVVIFAGYTKEMQDFLNANSGIVSRIGYTLEFEDYTVEELLKIFTQMMEKSGFIVTEEALKKVEEIINEYKDSRNFGNARFVRNLYEKAIVKHATNTSGKKNKKILKTITDKDINAENLLK
ncbi:MAG: AAA family ATPase [Clostridia bacterium]|nr:AAA family ATPase [Clostridia bacterium]